MKYLPLIAILLVPSKVWSVFGSEEGFFFTPKPKWGTTLINELKYHKGNAIFLRNHVERENKNFTHLDAEIFCELDFEKIFLDSEYARECVHICVRSIQALAEDQENFFETYRSKREEILRSRYCRATANLVRRVVDFSQHFNRRLSKMYTFLSDSFPEDECLEEVGDIFHKTTLRRLQKFPSKGGALVRQYNMRTFSLSCQEHLHLRPKAPVKRVFEAKVEEADTDVRRVQSIKLPSPRKGGGAVRRVATDPRF